MVDERPQAAKASKGIGKRLKKFIRFGSTHTQPSGSTPERDISSALVSGTHQQDFPLTQLNIQFSHTSTAVGIAVIAI